MIIVEGRGMLGVPGIAARTFTAVARAGANVLMISQSSSEQSISFVIREADRDAVIGQLQGEMAREMAHHHIDQVRPLDGIVIVAVVGAAMKGTPGVSSAHFRCARRGKHQRHRHRPGQQRMQHFAGRGPRRRGRRGAAYSRRVQARGVQWGLATSAFPKRISVLWYFLRHRYDRLQKQKQVVWRCSGYRRRTTWFCYRSGQGVTLSMQIRIFSVAKPSAIATCNRRSSADTNMSGSRCRQSTYPI